MIGIWILLYIDSLKLFPALYVLLYGTTFGILIASGLLADRLMLPLKMPFNLGNEQIQSDHLFLERPEMLVASIGTLFTLCLSGILILYLGPGRVRHIADSFPNKFRQLLRLMFMGFLIEILVVAVGIGSALMIGTFPLTILIVGAVFIIGLVGFVSLAYAVGRGMLQRAQGQNNSPIFSLLLGLLILLALFPIPVLGEVLLLAFTSFGLGATIVSHFGSGEPWNLNSLMEEATNEKTI